MAETFLNPVIEKLLDSFVEEVKTLRRVHREVKSLGDELAVIQPLLKDAESKLEKGEKSDAVKAWMKQLREEASCIEEVVDEYVYHNHRNGSTIGCLCKAAHFIKALNSRHKIASDIKNTKQSLSQIKGVAAAYGLRPFEQGVQATDVEAHDPRLPSLYVEDDELVGIELASKELVASLVAGPSTRLVISLIGEGGVGKTTLVKKVYEDDAVKEHFESARAWLTVSQSYNLKKLLKEMITKISKLEDKSMIGDSDTVEGLIDNLRGYLQAKRYVIIFDDVWQENFWGDIRLALPYNNQGSRIIITSRNSKVANSCKETPNDVIQNLQPWSLILGLELFCKKAFQGNCPQELMELSTEIVSKCQGLPLVIVAIASLLATKEKTESEWKKVLRDLKFKDEMSLSCITTIHKILSLSYSDLPYPQKLCFLYFGVFPEDYRIKDERLYRLWIAEGFVKARRGKTLEEVAQEYLKELVYRNLVLCDPERGIGEGTWFSVHDLMREVILQKVNEVCFSQIWDDENKESSGKGRRLSIYGSTKNVLEKVKSLGLGLRSMFFVDIEDQLTKTCIASLFKKFKLLEVLDIENARVDTLPISELGYLYNLKYLSLNSTMIRVLPKSISKLHNLQSLDVRKTLIRELPKEIKKLINLRHLLAYSYNPFACGVTMQKGFGDLVELQTLTLVEAHDVGLMEELEKLRKLRWLGVSKLTRETGKALCNSIGKMVHLERLYISSTDYENEVLDLQVHNSLSSLQFLKDLLLIGRLEKLPKWILTLPDLTGLRLSFSRLTDEPSKFLKALPNLETLHLTYQAFEGEQLHFEEGSFKKLQIFVLEGLAKLKVLKIDSGALPLLERLTITSCSLVQKVPSFQDLRNLKMVVIDGRRLLRTQVP